MQNERTMNILFAVPVIQNVLTDLFCIQGNIPFCFIFTPFALVVSGQI